MEVGIWPTFYWAAAAQIFDLMDKDQGGTLGIDEIKQLMDMLGLKACGLWRGLRAVLVMQTRAL